MSAGAVLLVGALGLAACMALGLVVLGIVLDHRDRAAVWVPVPEPVPAADLVPALVERAAALAGVFSPPPPAGAAIVTAVSAIQAHELAETRPTQPPPLPIAEPGPAANPVVHL